jgi:formate dehydrogenase subunit delta
MSSTEHLINMANDIGNFYRSQPTREAAIAGIVNHIKSYWTPRMREKIVAELQQGAPGLDELPLEAVRLLQKFPHTKPDHPPGGDAG